MINLQKGGFILVYCSWGGVHNNGEGKATSRHCGRNKRLANHILVIHREQRRQKGSGVWKCELLVLTDSVVSSDVFFRKLYYKRMFCWGRHMRGCFAEHRHVVFSGSCLVKEHVIFCLIFRKSISRTQQRVGDTLSLVRLAGFHWASLMLCFTDNLLALVHLAFFADVCLWWLHTE